MTLTTRIASLTDDQVIEEYRELAEADQDLEGALREIRAKLERDISSDEFITEEQKTKIIERLLEMYPDAINQIRDATRELYQQHYTVDEMRILLSFREEYPELSQKSREGAKKAGKMFGEWMEKMIKDTLAISMEILDDDLD